MMTARRGWRVRFTVHPYPAVMEWNRAEVPEVLDRAGFGRARSREHERTELAALVQHSSTTEVDR